MQPTLTLAGVAELASALRRRELTSLELVQAYLERIESLARLHAFVSVGAHQATEAARAADRALDAGSAQAPLLGVPIAVKDNIDVLGIDTTAGSPRFARRAAADAEVVACLRRAGAIVIGKTNMHELAYGATSLNPFFGDCRNPWGEGQIAGGSSGGSAIAVAAGLAPASLGTDTGGSVRIPAALTGVSALRPSRGRISTVGVVPISWTFDAIGPFARQASDLALLFSLLANSTVPRDDSCLRPLAGIRLKLVTEAQEWAEPDVASTIEDGLVTLAELGARVERVRIADLSDWSACMTLLVRAEAFAIYRERLEKSPDAFGDDVRRRLELGRDISGADYAAARERTRIFRRRFNELVSGREFLVLPTTSVVAPSLGESELLATTAKLTELTYPWSLVGAAALSIPCGFSRTGLPIGLQIVAGAGLDELGLNIAIAYQRVTDWHHRDPGAGSERRDLRPAAAERADD